MVTWIGHSGNMDTSPKPFARGDKERIDLENTQNKGIASKMDRPL
jgi:hypothetical protein